MTLRLAIENMDRLPDGGPLRVEVKARGLDIGRDAHLDWTLPDPSRYVSGKHCEIRYRDNEYWLYDVSTNGTFVNGAQFRLDAPYRLRDQDRLAIGPYIVAVSIEGGRAEPAEAAGIAATAAATADVWGAVGDVAPPEGREAYRVRKGPATPGDFLDFATDAGVSLAPAAASVWGSPAAAPPPDEAWLTAPPPPRPAPPPPPDPRELPLVERPRPIRPAEPVAAPPPVVAPAPPLPVAAPAFEPPAPVFEAAPAFETTSAVFEAPAPVVAVPPPAVPPPAAAPVAPAAFEPPPPPRPQPDASLLNRIAAAAGIPLTAIAGRDPNEVADEIGAVLRLTAQNLVQIAASRRQTKSAIRSSQHTMYKPTENNPIKFAASAEHAMETMFGPPSRIHLRAPAAVAQAFNEAKAHNVLTYGAMQSALEALFAELAPDKIEASLEPERGLSALMLASRKARLWDAYAERWRTLTKRADGRLNDAFMGLFAEAYDRLNEQGG